MLGAMEADFFVDIQSAGKIVQADVANRQVEQTGGNVLRISNAAQVGVGMLVPVQSFFETVETVENIANVTFQPREPQRIAMTLEYFVRLLRPFEGFIVLAEENQGLEGPVQSARDVQRPVKVVVEGDRVVVVFQRFVVISSDVENMPSNGLRSVSP